MKKGYILGEGQKKQLEMVGDHPSYQSMLAFYPHLKAAGEHEETRDDMRLCFVSLASAVSEEVMSNPMIGGMMLMRLFNCWMADNKDLPIKDDFTTYLGELRKNWGRPQTSVHITS